MPIEIPIKMHYRLIRHNENVNRDDSRIQDLEVTHLSGIRVMQTGLYNLTGIIGKEKEFQCIVHVYSVPDNLCDMLNELKNEGILSWNIMTTILEL